MMVYLVQIQVKKPSGKVHLISVKHEAESAEDAYKWAQVLFVGTGEIIGAYVTGDEYKIMRIGTGA